MDFGLAVLRQKEAEPVALGHKDFVDVAAGLDPDLVLTRVDPVDMSIKVVSTWVDLVAARATIAAVKVVHAAIEVSWEDCDAYYIFGCTVCRNCYEGFPYGCWSCPYYDIIWLCYYMDALTATKVPLLLHGWPSLQRRLPLLL